MPFSLEEKMKELQQNNSIGDQAIVNFCDIQLDEY